MATTHTSTARRLTAAVTAAALALAPMGQVAYGALTLLSDVPIAAKVAAKPNVIYTLDDSGSMTQSWLPDYVIGAYCRNTSGTGTQVCKHASLGGAPYIWGLEEPMFSADFNRLHYNPDVTYEPPVDGAGNQATAAFPNGTPAATAYKMMTSANTAAWTAVKSDPYLSAATANISTMVDTLVYCNTDWPRTAYATASNTSPTAWAEVGDANGEYLATAGRDCRINGTQYIGGLDGEPAITDDYNYPFFRNSGSVDDPKYYYRNGFTNSAYRYKYIWCDKTAAGWPQKCVAGASTCAGIITTPPSQPQTCYFSSWQTGADTTVGVPAGCLSWPAGIGQPVGGCVGTIGIECLACNYGTKNTGKNGVCHLTATGTGGSSAACNCAGATCTLPACANYQPPDTCSTGWVPGAPTCSPYASAACNSLYAGSGSGGSPPTGTPSLLDDANGAGITCRHNNNSGSYTSNRFTYNASHATYKTAVSDSTCGYIPQTSKVPRYYYRIASVQFCNNTIATNNVQWRGFGTGTCKTKNDLTTYKNVTYGKFTRIGLYSTYPGSSSTGYPYVDADTGVAGNRTYAEEMTNYANWYAYYRTRVLAAKTTTGIAFNNVDNSFRVGFHTFNTTLASGNTLVEWLDTADFDATQRTNWYNKLFGVSIQAGKQTPTLDAMLRIGSYVENGAAGITLVPAHNDPFPTVAGNPVTCTPNYHVLFTDGFTNQPTLPTVVGERDGATIPSAGAIVDGKPVLLPDPGPSEPDKSVASFTALNGTKAWTTYGGGPWPRPYLDAAPATANTLADISLYYWMRDLRSGYTDNVPHDDGSGGKDLLFDNDPAWWQHITFNAVSFGSEGLLDASQPTAVMTSITSGPTNWFLAGNAPTPPNSPTTPAANAGATAVDDLWHATVNSRGRFVYANTPLDVARGLASIIARIGNNQKARVGAAFAGQQLTTAGPNPTDFVFQATIEPGWVGDLKKVTVNTTTGVQGVTRWSAASLLNTLLATPAPGTSPLLDSNNTWFANRRIVTRNTDAGTFTVVPFRYASLSGAPATQLNTLAATATRQQMVISYLRGGSTYGAGPTPQVIEGTGVGQFRVRKGKLGDISDSKPLVVVPPMAPFVEANDYGYAAFKTAHAARDLRVYVGANDGMFHVFDGRDNTGPNTGGTEVWAYIPSGVFTTATDEGGRAKKGLQALTYQDGGAPIYKHHFYVNAAPRSMDVDFANCGSNSACTPNWKTLVVAGLGKGGNTYFAIDGTDVAVPDETTAAAKVLWEWSVPSSQFSYARPVIAKTRAYGWVVIIASGYNNGGDGKGHLYFLRASDGALLRTLNTTAADPGSVASPSGLAQINGFTKDASNQIVEQIYGGDLNGNFWRWDVSDPDPTTWQAKTRLLATLTAPAGCTVCAQPVTTAPQIEININNGIDRWVFIGTGRLLHPDDLTNPSPEQIETMYAIRDGTLDAPSYTGLPILPRSGTLAAVGGMAGVAGAAPNGWYHDLPAGQRIVNDVVADFNLVAYGGTAVQPDPCLTSLPAYIYARDYETGESLVYTGGIQQPYYYSLEGAVGLELVALDVPGSSFPKLGIVFTRETNATIQPIEVKPKSFSGGHRLSWRLLGD